MFYFFLFFHPLIIYFQDRQRSSQTRGQQRERIKRGKEITERQEIKGNEETNRRRKDNDKNNLLHDIHKSVQPPTYSGGVNLKLEAHLSFLGTVENLFEREFLEKEKVKAVSFLLRERAHLWWTYVKTNEEVANKGLGEITPLSS